ncbi:nonselective cation channel [Verticillium alfalfae VaMs.102]|uniref:Nonselective cation channel n=1 Tax=Verticillium alfalfae (strain VaMs.102 / ATCC MYA-4576 / FGSC 10136) TaxID=526221 RepID=C9SNR0_VERA1|nr:nonselective cation channel [Verticillium alfalfae VaMs.102]EEY20425.1 nonselective cation channel [Verticillium alfalfae VaMs.102]
MTSTCSLLRRRPVPALSLSLPLSKRQTLQSRMDRANDAWRSRGVLDDDDDDAGDSRSETEACLVEEIETDDEKRAEALAGLPVYMTIHRVRRLIIASIQDDEFSREQLKDPRVNSVVVRPLVDKLYDPSNISTVYALLANRVQFLREQTRTLDQTINLARSTLCELAATQSKALIPSTGPDCCPVRGANSVPVQDQTADDDCGRRLTALELAIVSESKSFINSPACRRVVNAVYEGRIVYTPNSFIDILPDRYHGHQPIALYDPRKAPVLNHRRLIVPRNRNAIEFVHFVILVVLYVLTMTYRNSRNETFELLFVVWTTGWVLAEFAAIIEHGWEVHSQALWSFLDMSFTCVFFAYLLGRVYDASVGTFPDGLGLKLLCIAAPVLLTRLAFNLMPDNIVFISLHAMMKDFTLLTFLALWCFTGFLLAMQWLIDANDNSSVTPSWATTGKWMLWIWFGLDGTGVDQSVDFHLVLGPALMIAFAFLGNTLFLTILVAMLTNTFSKIIADEAAEIQFRRTVLTFEGVKSDAIFAYPPACNVLALLVLLLLKMVVSPRRFHDVHVALVRTVNAPTLLLIALYERRFFAARRPTQAWLVNWRLAGLSPQGDVQAVFKMAPPPDVCDAIERMDVVDEYAVPAGSSAQGALRWRARGADSSDLKDA